MHFSIKLNLVYIYSQYPGWICFTDPSTKHSGIAFFMKDTYDASLEERCCWWPALLYKHQRKGKTCGNDLYWHCKSKQIEV